MLRHLTRGTKLPSDQNELKVDSVNIMMQGSLFIPKIDFFFKLRILKSKSFMKTSRLSMDFLYFIL